MGKINSSVFDTGPFIHLYEINFLQALKLFKRIIIVEELINEIRGNKTLVSEIKRIKLIKTLKLGPKFKDLAKLLIEKYSLDLTEAECISLALQESAEIFFTDDLDARNVAKELNIDVHGTIGIILRAYRENIITKNEAINKIKELYTKSSLFITKDLVEWSISQIRDYKK